MTELEKHKKLNFLFYKIFRELYQGKTNPSSLGEVGKITDILVSSIFSNSKNENYAFSFEKNLTIIFNFCAGSFPATSQTFETYIQTR